MAARKVAFADVSVDRLRVALTFDFETGDILWREPAPGRKVGRTAGWVCKGHRHITVDYQTMQAHRAMWAVFYGEWPTELIDHRDTNPLNNRITNLRVATKAENGFNRGAQKNNKSGLKGVSWLKRERLFIAQIRANGINYRLGYFKKAEDAAAAYAAAAAIYHGDFARTR